MGCVKIGLMRIALVHDDLIQHGGAERLFEAMMEIWPEADIFTSMTTWDRRVKVSFMQKLPFKEKLYRHYFPLYPLAFESFDFSEYDVALSSTTRFAHGVITRPETLHIAYFNTPPRMFWEPFTYFESNPSLRSLLSPFLSYTRVWDRVSAQRPDALLANAKTPQGRIKKYYGRAAEIIYPFVDLERFNVGTRQQALGNSDGEDTSAYSLVPNAYFLIVSRLTAWKRIDIAIEACNQLNLPLKIIGEGPDFVRLKKLAGPTVEFLGRLTDEEVVRYYKRCRAFLFPQKEDFGITPLEAQAAGRPVIAFKAGGALETVIDKQTGEFFYPQTTGALTKVLKNFDPERYQRANSQKQAEKFSKKRFQTELKVFVEKAYEKHTRAL